MRLCALLLAGLAASTLNWSAPSQAAPAAAAASAEVRLPHISVVSIGKGDPVVLIPGLASPRAVWAGITPELAKKHRVLLVQVNGFGGDPAGANAKGEILSGAVSDLAGYLAQQKIRRPAVIGHSMGGLIGMMLTKAHPDAVGKVMIVDSLPFFGVIMNPGATVDSVRPIAEQLRTMVSNGPLATQAPPNMSLTDAGNARVLEWLRASDKAVAGEALYEDLSTDFRADVPSLAGRPVTIVYAVPSAERSETTRNLYADAYAKVPGAKLVPIEKSAHFVMLDQPEAFASAVKTFLGD
ncbi:MAG: alpha/beta hydrolase [Sphingomicrobium sp.]